MAITDGIGTKPATLTECPLDSVVTGHRGGPRTVHWVYLQVLRELAHHCSRADNHSEQIPRTESSTGHCFESA
jgi:hypothetical protein